MTLAEWLDFLEHRPQPEIQLGLERIRTVGARLQALTPDAVVITVAGTNGKGSTVATLEAIYSEAGYCVGSYTSPHLLTYNERIRLNKKPISDEAIVEAFQRIDDARGEIHLTYFEIATLAALLVFKKAQPDVIVLEVGIGGRLDATTIVDADCAIITTVDFDHEEYLGDTLEAIGFEKAGILKPNQQFIYADANMPSRVQQRAAELNITPCRLHHEYAYVINDTAFTLTIADETWILPKPKVHPNAAAAGVVAARCLNQRLPVEGEALSRGIETTQINGRQQVVRDTISTIFDVSHNPQAVLLLADRILALTSEINGGKVHAVFSGLKDKNLCGLINPMRPWVDEWYSAVLQHPRAAPEEALRAAFDDVKPRFYDTITAAYEAAVASASPGDWVVVYGSFFAVGPIMFKENCVCSG